MARAAPFTPMAGKPARPRMKAQEKNSESPPISSPTSIGVRVSPAPRRAAARKKPGAITGMASSIHFRKTSP